MPDCEKTTGGGCGVDAIYGRLPLLAPFSRPKASLSDAGDAAYYLQTKGLDDPS
jgi:hypothetical protein